MVAFSGQTSWAAKNIQATKLACAIGNAVFPGQRWFVEIKLCVARNKKIDQSIMIIIAPGWASGPPAQCDTGFFSNVSKRSIVVVVIKPVLPKIRDINVGPTVIVVIPNCHPEAPALIRNSGFCGHVGKSAIVVVVEQHGPRSGCFSSLRISRRAVQ